MFADDRTRIRWMMMSVLAAPAGDGMPIAVQWEKTWVRKGLTAGTLSTTTLSNNGTKTRVFEGARAGIRMEWSAFLAHSLFIEKTS